MKHRLIRSYAQLGRRSMRTALRSIALTGLSWAQSLTGEMETALSRPRVHFLLLHHIYPNEEQRFVQLIEWLSQSGHAFLSYSEAVHRVANGKIDKPYVAFSFDDGLSSCLTAGELLYQFGVGACFFVNAEIIGETDPDKIRLFCRNRHDMRPAGFLSWADIERLLRLGNEVGGHTYSHANLAQLAPHEIEEELSKERAILTGRFGDVKHFAWPYGKTAHFTATAREQIFHAGYLTCASGLRGAHTIGAQNVDFCIRREHLIAGWPKGHIAYLMARSAAKSNRRTNLWPTLAD